jgi:DNA-binding HxlR family transcriptional regulator
MNARERAAEAPGRFAYEGLQRVLHEKARLGIMTSLVTHSDGLLFTDLKELCALTDGNLNRHLKVLSDERLIELRKEDSAKRPQTHYRITAGGRRRFIDYLAELERVVADAAAAAQASRSSARQRGKSKRSIFGGLSPAS